MATFATNLWNDLLSSDVRRQVIAGVIAGLAVVILCGAAVWVAKKVWRSGPKVRAAFAVRRVEVNGATYSEHISLDLTNFGADPVHLRGFYLVDYPNGIARLLRARERVLRMPKLLSDEQIDAGGTTRFTSFQLARGVPRQLYLGEDGKTIELSRRSDVFCVLEQADRKILRARKVERRES